MRNSKTARASSSWFAARQHKPRKENIMADRIRFDMKGWDELKRGLEQLGPELATRAGKSAIRAGAKVLSEEVKAGTPVGDDDTSRSYRTKGGQSVTVDYGHMRDNIKIKMGRPKKAFNVERRVAFMSVLQENAQAIKDHKSDPKKFPAVEPLDEALVGIVYSVVDENGDLMFTIDDIPDLKKLPYTQIQHLYLHMMSLAYANGDIVKDVAAEKKG